MQRLRAAGNLLIKQSIGSSIPGVALSRSGRCLCLKSTPWRVDKRPFGESRRCSSMPQVISRKKWESLALEVARRPEHPGTFAAQFLLTDERQWNGWLLRFELISNSKMRSSRFRPEINARRSLSTAAARREVLITANETPNPNARKFSWENQDFLPTWSPDSISYSDKSKCKSSPLAKKLLEIAGVNSVLLARKHITVIKSRDARWSYVDKFAIFEIQTHLENDLPIYVGPADTKRVHEQTFATPKQVTETSVAENRAGLEEGSGEQSVLCEPDATDENDEEDTEEDDEDVVESIKAHLDTRARPMLQQDGGDLEFLRFDKDDGIVYLYLKGSCQGCPSSSMTLRFGIKGMLQHYVPQVKDVIQCDENGEALG